MKKPCCICNGTGVNIVYEEGPEFIMKPYEVKCVDCNGTGWVEER
jgi:DnaJ-class molecular chaperone